MADVADGASDPLAVASVLTEVMRWFTVLPESIEHDRATLPSYADWLALDAGRAVGAGWCVELPDMKESTACLGGVSVLPEERRRGVGSALFAHVVGHARSLGKQDLETIAFEDDPDGVAFAERRGFVAIARNRSLRLELSDCQPPVVAPPADVEVTTLVAHPELDVALWEIACETMPDIPFDGDVPLHPGTLDEFRSMFLADPAALPDATFVAVQDGVAVGFAQLAWDDPTRGIAVHRMLAVRRSHRGRGIAAALKARQIAWAIEHGLSELRTANEDRNAAARAVNARFPYAPIPDQLVLRGPLPPVG